MRKKIFFYLALLLCACNAEAQKGNNQVAILAELTFTAGVSKFNSKDNVESAKVNTRLIPFLAGYKQNLHKFT